MKRLIILALMAGGLWTAYTKYQGLLPKNTKPEFKLPTPAPAKLQRPEILRASGEVSLKSSSGSKSAQTGTVLETGDQLELGEAAYVILVFGHLSYLRLAPSSVLAIKAPESSVTHTLFDLRRGRAFFNHQGHGDQLMVVGPHVQLSSAGAIFLVEIMTETKVGLLDGHILIRPHNIDDPKKLEKGRGLAGNRNGEMLWDQAWYDGVDWEGMSKGTNISNLDALIKGTRGQHKAPVNLGSASPTPVAAPSEKGLGGFLKMVPKAPGLGKISESVEAVEQAKQKLEEHNQKLRDIPMDD